LKGVFILPRDMQRAALQHTLVLLRQLKRYHSLSSSTLK